MIYAIYFGGGKKSEVTKTKMNEMMCSLEKHGQVAFLLCMFLAPC